MSDTFEVATLELEWFDGSQGYDPDFLGQPVPLPRLSPQRTADLAPLLDGSGHELRYTHFSVVMSKSRRLAVFTAVNIDGAHVKEPHRERDIWLLDPRIDAKHQCANELYKRSSLDRGHLVRRLDPVWGDEALKAQEDTFHFTNAAPQQKKLNRKTWLGLEDYILSNTDLHDLRVSVFTGPIFRDDDRVYRKIYRIPAEFWKVVVLMKTDGGLSATGYLLTQRDLISDLEGFTFGKYQTYQTQIGQLEGMTGLNFGELRKYDPLEREEGNMIHVIGGAGDLRL
ncbi:MAG: DNA/RNA non-specific endonuclease [Anaerolineales bacterium]|nr:DNA/RNA non-specific endonuclease [Anaerolineales bacterium]